MKSLLAPTATPHYMAASQGFAGSSSVSIPIAVRQPYGLLAAVAAAIAGNSTGNAVFTFDADRAYFAGSVVQAALIMIFGLFGWQLSRGKVA